MGDPGVTILARYVNQVEAGLAVSMLSQNGIESWLEDEEIVNQVWYWGNAVGGIKLVVRKEDEAKAREAMLSIRSLQILPEMEVETASQDRVGKTSLILSMLGVIGFPPLLNLLSIGYKLIHYRDIRSMTPLGTRWLWCSIILDLSVISLVTALVYTSKASLFSFFF